MKKFLLFMAVICTFASNANAETDVNTNAFGFKTYIGIDIGVAKMDLSDGFDFLFEDTYATVSLKLGVKMSYCGLELFYQASSEEEGPLVINRSTGMLGTLQTSFFAYGLDAIGYLPITEELDLLGTIGMGIYDVEAEGLGLSDSATGTGSRFGLGAEYNITDNFAIRAISRYVILNVDGLDSLSEFTLGIKYSF